MAGKGGGDAEGDDSASLFFLMALLACVVLPWTLNVVWSFFSPGRVAIALYYPKIAEDGSRVRQCQTSGMVAKRAAHCSTLTSRRLLCTKAFMFRTAILLLLWCWLLYILSALRGVMSASSLYADFDPHQILEVSRYASKSDVKKSWRKLSLKYHPDKNKEAGAVEKFILMKKAYDSLTDPIAMENYKRYGNPDGPTRVSLGVAIPTVSKDQQGIVLVLFLVLFVLGVPITMLLCMAGQGPSLSANGVQVDTMEMLAQKLVSSTDVKSAQALLLASPECIDVALQDSLLEELDRWTAELKLKVPAGDRRAAAAAALLALHCQRKHGELSESARRELYKLLPKWRLVALGIAEVAVRQGWLAAFESAMELHHCVLQALVPGSSGQELLQVPHFDADRIKLLRKGPNKNLGLLGFAEMPEEARRKALEGLGLSPAELLDVEEFARFVPRLAVQQVSVDVEGEDDICKDDIATLHVKFCRQQLTAGEAAGAVHAPFFADLAVPEVWWVSLTLSVRGARTRVTKVMARVREYEATVKFKVPSIGKNRGTVTLLCESYAGLTIEKQVSFDAKRPEVPGNGGADPDDEMSDLSGHGED